MIGWSEFQDQVPLIAARHSPAASRGDWGEHLWELLGLRPFAGPGPRVAALVDESLHYMLAEFSDVYRLPPGFSSKWIELVRPTHLVIQSSLARSLPWSAHTTSEGLVTGPLREAISQVNSSGAQTLVVVDESVLPPLYFGRVEYLPNARSRNYIESTEIPDVIYASTSSFASATVPRDGSKT